MLIKLLKSRTGIQTDMQQICKMKNKMFQTDMQQICKLPVFFIEF